MNDKATISVPYPGVVAALTASRNSRGGNARMESVNRSKTLSPQPCR